MTELLFYICWWWWWLQILWWPLGFWNMIENWTSGSYLMKWFSQFKPWKLLLEHVHRPQSQYYIYYWWRWWWWLLERMELTSCFSVPYSFHLFQIEPGIRLLTPSYTYLSPMLPTGCYMGELATPYLISQASSSSSSSSLWSSSSSSWPSL